VWRAPPRSAATRTTAGRSTWTCWKCPASPTPPACSPPTRWDSTRTATCSGTGGSPATGAVPRTSERAPARARKDDRMSSDDAEAVCAPRAGTLYDVLELILDRGMVIDVFVRVSLVGIEILKVDARIVVASVDTYLRFAEACNRLDLEHDVRSKTVPELFGGPVAKTVGKGAARGAAGEAPRAGGRERGERARRRTRSRPAARRRADDGDEDDRPRSRTRRRTETEEE